jgi:CheY-like chemotaxis protein/HPt (histidine-containing phosphotransfer) domain-containing protein
MRARAIDKTLDFNVTLKGPIPQQITTDPLRIKQILVNLLGNAIKFTHMGQIELAVECIPGDDTSQIRFDISDTGIGMTEGQVAQLFQPFSQADESMSRKYGGTGLGLTISKRLASLLGGDIAVKSKHGEGSTFTVMIDGGPLTGVTMRTDITESLASASSAPAQRKIRLRARILLAEDGADNQRLISMHLRKAGAEVTIADNGRIAVEMARSERFDLIIMDMQMPELDGYGATSELRRRGFHQPIIALTAHAMAEDRARCLQAGCTDYLTKPIDKLQLLTTIDAHLQHSTGRSHHSAPAAQHAKKPQHGDAVTSALADDPDMKELIAQFTRQLPQSVSELQRQLDQGNLEELARIAHRMKGAGGGYGFNQITELAATAEKAINDAAPLESITGRVNELIALIRRVNGYDSSREGHREERPAAKSKKRPKA